VSRAPLLIDVAAAVVVAAVVVLVAPGWAIVAIIALVALVICGISWLVGRRRPRARPPKPRGRGAKPRMRPR
jgi:hypothetical protein